MLGLQDLFEKEKNEAFKTNRILTRMFEEELEQIGLLISNTQRRDFEKQFSNLKNGLKIDFSDEQIQNAGFKCDEDLVPEIEKIITKLPERVSDFTVNIDKKMMRIIEDVTDEAVGPVLKTLNHRLKDMNKDQDDIYNHTAESINAIWGEPLILLKGFITIIEEATEWYINREDEFAENDLVRDLLHRLTSKAVQISKEIFTLLRNGYSDGAQARWRSLHELSVICLFISEHGNNVAKRYIKHQAIDKYKSAKQHNEYYSRLGAKQIPTKTMNELSKVYEELIAEYGQSYKNAYGWAAKVLSLKNPRFSDIEASINLDHHRPYYKAASANIHVDPTGVFNSLGQLPFEEKPIAGASVLGLCSPSQSLLISVNIIATTMLTHGSTVDSIVICKVLAKYSRAVENEFIEAQKSIENSFY